MKLMMGRYGFQACFRNDFSMIKNSGLISLHLENLFERASRISSKKYEKKVQRILWTRIDLGYNFQHRLMLYHGNKTKMPRHKKIAIIIWNVSLCCWTDVHSVKVFLNGQTHLHQTWIGYWQVVSIYLCVEYQFWDREKLTKFLFKIRYLFRSMFIKWKRLRIMFTDWLVKMRCSRQLQLKNIQTQLFTIVQAK